MEQAQMFKISSTIVQTLMRCFNGTLIGFHTIGWGAFKGAAARDTTISIHMEIIVPIILAGRLLVGVLLTRMPMASCG